MITLIILASLAIAIVLAILLMFGSAMVLAGRILIIGIPVVIILKMIRKLFWGKKKPNDD